MALRLAAADGIELTVYDVAPEPVAELVAAGATAAESVAELADRVDVVCVMVRDDDQVRDVLGRGPRRGRRRAVVVDPLDRRARHAG